ncbi:MAG TPA: MFS transporter [Gemmataceae bacterium]|jgi:ACS family hexuronate transporter-like MFS transporter
MGTPPAPVAAWKWGVVWLLFLATVINYMDRQTVTNLAVPIKAAFTSDQSAAALDGLFNQKPDPDDGKRHLNNEGYGTIEAAFAITYALFQVIAGFLVDRRSLWWLYVGAMVLWSAAGFATGLVRTVEMLIVCRLMLGIGEAFNWPCAVAAIQRLLPREQHSLANGVFHSGASLGAIGTPLLIFAMVDLGGAHWQSVFLVVGGAGAVWVVLWLAVVRGERAAAVDHRPARGDRADSPGLGETLRAVFAGRAIWIALAVGLTVNLFWHFCRVWLPLYLDQDLGLGFKATGGTAIDLPWGTWVVTPRAASLFILAAFYVAADLGALAAGWATRRLTRAGWSVEAARKAVMLGTSGLCLLTIPAVRSGSAAVAVPLLLLAAAGAMGGFANYFALTQEVSPRHTGFVVGLVGALAWAVLTPVQPEIGRIADRIGTFVPVFQVMACVPMVGSVIGLLWPAAPPASPGPARQ